MFAVFFVWFASIVTYLSIVFAVSAITLLGSLAIWFIATAIHNDCYKDKKPYPLSSKGGRWMVGLGLASSLIWAVLPSEKTVYLMGGAYIGQSVIQSETAGKVVNILNSKLDTYVEEAAQQAKKALPKEVKKVVLPEVEAAVEAKKE